MSLAVSAAGGIQPVHHHAFRAQIIHVQREHIVGTEFVGCQIKSGCEMTGEGGGHIIEVNTEETGLTGVAEVALRGPAGVVLPELLG